MSPVTRQDQRLSLRAGSTPAQQSTDLALQQILDEFDNYKRMMSAQNRDIIKTNVFGQARIRSLEEQITALEERVTSQTALRARVEARASRLEHQLACVQIAFNFLSSVVPGASSETQSFNMDTLRLRDRIDSARMPLPPAQAKSSAVKLDRSTLPPAIVRPVARAPAFVLGRVQEEHGAATNATSPERKPGNSYPLLGAGVSVDHNGALLYPPLPSPTCTDTSGAPSPVRTPDLDFPLTLPLNIGNSSTTLSGLNIRIEPSGTTESSFQPSRLESRPNLFRSDSASWTVKSATQPAMSGEQQDADVRQQGSPPVAEEQSEANRATVRRRMQGRTSSLMPPANLTSTTTGSRSSIVGSTSPWALNATHTKGTDSSDEETATRVVLSDTSNTFVPKKRGPLVSGLTLQPKPATTARNYEHIDTPVLVSSTFPELELRQSKQVHDRFATIPSARKRKVLPGAPRTSRSRSRSEESCLCQSEACECEGFTNTHVVSERSGTSISATPEPGSETPRGRNATLPDPPEDVRKANTGPERQSSGEAHLQDSGAEEAERGVDNAESRCPNGDEEPDHEDQSTSGRPMRRARSSVNYTLPKLNTKMRKPDAEPSAKAPSEAAKISSRTSLATGSSSHRKTSAHSALRAAVAAHSKRLSAPPGSSSTTGRSADSHESSRSRSSSSDMSIMSLSSGSGATPVARSPALGIHFDAPSQSGSAVDVAKELSSGSRTPGMAAASVPATAEAETDKSSGSSTIMASASSPPLNRVDDEANVDLERSRPLDRAARRSSATVTYTGSKLNTKLRKTESELPSANRQDQAPTAVNSRRGSRSVRAQEEDGRADGGGTNEKAQGADAASAGKPVDSFGSSVPESAGVSANIAHYSTRTLRKSTIPNYTLPKLNTKIRKPDAEASSLRPATSSPALTAVPSCDSARDTDSEVLHGSSAADSPKRKAAKRTTSEENFSSAKSSASLSRASSKTSRLVPAHGTKSLGRAGAAQAALAMTASGVTSQLSNTTGGSVPSPRASLHAMLTHHPPRERSGSSTSSASTVRGMPSFGSDLLAISSDASGDEHAPNRSGEARHEASDDDDDTDASDSDDDLSSEPNSSSERRRTSGGGTMNQHCPDSSMAFVHEYDDRMDPVLFSDPVPSSPPGLETSRTTRPSLHTRVAKGRAVEAKMSHVEHDTSADADSTEAGSLRAAGSTSQDSIRDGSEYDDSTVTHG